MAERVINQAKRSEHYPAVNHGGANVQRAIWDHIAKVLPDGIFHIFVYLHSNR